MRRTFLAAVLIGAAIAIGACRRAPAEQPPRRPNILFILLDDLRWDALGYAGHPYVKTPQHRPHRQRGRELQECLLHDVALLAEPCVAPERASTPTSTASRTTSPSSPHSSTNFPKTLHQAGYDTAYVGKWHMGEGNDEPRPGFDYFVTHKGQGKYFDTEFNLNGQRREVARATTRPTITEHRARLAAEAIMPASRG